MLQDIDGMARRLVDQFGEKAIYKATLMRFEAMVANHHEDQRVWADVERAIDVMNRRQRATD